MVESSTATGVAVLLKIENVERIQASVLAKSEDLLKKSDVVGQRLDGLKDTVASVVSLSQQLARNLRYTEQIFQMSVMIRQNLNHASVQTVLYFAAGLSSGFIGNVLAARRYFAGVTTPRLLIWLALIIVVTFVTQLAFTVAASDRARVL